MGVVEALQEKGKALAALNVYRNQSEELNRLTMYLNTGTKVNEHPEFIKRVAWLQESMNKNSKHWLKNSKLHLVKPHQIQMKNWNQVQWKEK
jgi:hypothetical protein